jgi:probable HAF family extracellular repeat protein
MQQRAHYKLVDLGTFGGPQSYVYFPPNYAPLLNDQNATAGWADTLTPDPYPNFCFNDDCYVSKVFEWRDGVRTELEGLAMGLSSQANWISKNGLIAGVSQIGLIDPLFPSFPVSHAVLWKQRQTIDLGTTDGGYESAALAVNSRGQVVGAAANEVPDPDAMFGLNFGWVTQTRAFLWQNGNMQDLGTLRGVDGVYGTNAVADLINEQGQVVGESYVSSTPSRFCGDGNPLETRAFLWEHGVMQDIGNFGGTCTFAADLNDQGQVVGQSNLAGDQSFHAFLWDHGLLRDLHQFGTLGGDRSTAIALNNAGEIVGWASLSGDQFLHAVMWKGNSMTDLGTVDGDPCSIGFSVNAIEQVVGISVPNCDFSQTTRVFLWEKGTITDLNALIPQPSSLYLTAPETINDRGEIAGVGLDLEGNQHAFLLIPCDNNHPDIEGCDYGLVDSAAAPHVRSPLLAPAVKPVEHHELTWADRLARTRSIRRRPELMARPPESPLAIILKAPSGLTTSTLNTYQIKLSWQEASGQTLSGFNIYRCVGCSSPRTQGVRVASVGATVLAYTDGSSAAPLTESENYTYQVTAFGTNNESSPSNVSAATTKTEPAPTNLTSFAFVRGGFDDVVRLSWTNNSSDDDSYFVESCTGLTCTNFSVVAQLPANDTSDIQGYQFIHKVTVRYRVRTHSPGGFSAYSNVRNQLLP